MHRSQLLQFVPASLSSSRAAAAGFWQQLASWPLAGEALLSTAADCPMLNPVG